MARCKRVCKTWKLVAKDKHYINYFSACGPNPIFHQKIDLNFANHCTSYEGIKLALENFLIHIDVKRLLIQTQDTFTFIEFGLYPWNTEFVIENDILWTCIRHGEKLIISDWNLNTFNMLSPIIKKEKPQTTQLLTLKLGSNLIGKYPSRIFKIKECFDLKNSPSSITFSLFLTESHIWILHQQCHSIGHFLLRISKDPFDMNFILCTLAYPSPNQYLCSYDTDHSFVMQELNDDNWIVHLACSSYIFRIHLHERDKKIYTTQFKLVPLIPRSSAICTSHVLFSTKEVIYVQIFKDKSLNFYNSQGLLIRRSAFFSSFVDKASLQFVQDSSNFHRIWIYHRDYPYKTDRHSIIKIKDDRFLPDKGVSLGIYSIDL